MTLTRPGAAVVPTALADPLAVTAVVPTHRRPELMRQAVQSIVDQSYEGLIEISVVFAAHPEVRLVGTAMQARSVGAQAIFMETVDRIDRPSLTGRMVHPFVDEYLTRWDALSDRMTKATTVDVVR